MDEVLFEGKHLIFRRAESWEYVERRGSVPGVMVVAFTGDDRLLLVEEFRPPVRANVISLPAGLVGDEGNAESSTEAARRELLEETGHECSDLRLLGEGPASPGLSSETVAFYLARDVRKRAEPRLEEVIRVHLVPLAELASWTRQRRAEDAQIHPMLWAGLYLASLADPAPRK